MTLTLGKLFRLININHRYKFHQDLISRSCFIGKPILSHYCIFDIDLDLCPRDLVSTLRSHQYLIYMQVSSRSNHSFMINTKNKFFLNTACLTLTFDLVTLTLCQLFLLININHRYKFHQDMITRSCCVCKPILSHNCIFNLDL